MNLMMDAPDNEDAIKPAGIVRRFLARLVDINIELIASLFILGPIYIPSPITNAIVIFAGAMLIDFFINYFFGNSLGKFLCALSVRKNGAKMQLRDCWDLGGGLCIWSTRNIFIDNVVANVPD